MPCTTGMTNYVKARGLSGPSRILLSAAAALAALSAGLALPASAHAAPARQAALAHAARSAVERVPALHGARTSASSAPAVTGTVYPAGIDLIPDYVYPGDYGTTAPADKGKEIWDHICDTASTPPGGPDSAIIANPASGPGTSVDSTWTAAISYCQTDQITVLGYVDTGYGAVSVATAESNINTWVRLYPGIQGIFFDEVASGASDSSCPSSNCKAYYSTLVSYAKSKISGGLVVANPGTNPTSDWVFTDAHPFDWTTLFEGPFSQYTSSWSPPSWLTNAETNRVVTLVYQDAGTTDSAAADASAICSEQLGDGIGIGVGWSNQPSDYPWGTDPTTVTGNGIWDDYLADC